MGGCARIYVERERERDKEKPRFFLVIWREAAAPTKTHGAKKIFLVPCAHLHKYYGAPGPGGRGTASSASGAPPIQSQFATFLCGGGKSGSRVLGAWRAVGVVCVRVRWASRAGRASRRGVCGPKGSSIYNLQYTILGNPLTVTAAPGTRWEVGRRSWGAQA